MPKVIKEKSIVDIAEVSERYPSKDYIFIKNARQHNLKITDIFFPKQKLIVITGPSGSGKSSLAIDTLYAEGRRKYAESLSAYIRQFLGKIEKPKVDFIHGLSPAIALEQRVVSNNPRSSVGTVTEIYDYLKILFLRIAKIYDPESGREIKKHHPSDVLNFILNLKEGTKFYILSPADAIIKNFPDNWLQYLIHQGINRVFFNEKLISISSDNKVSEFKHGIVYLLMDRGVVPENKEDDDFRSRTEDGILAAFKEGEGKCSIYYDGKFEFFNQNLGLPGFANREPDITYFNYLHPNGACPTCNGFGNTVGLDPDKIFPDKTLSVYDDAIACWRGEVFGWYKHQLLKNAWKFKFPVHKPISELSPDEYNLLWEGNEYFTGILEFFRGIEKELYKIQNRVFLSRYRGKTVCPECGGSRLNKRTDCFKINGRHLRSLITDEVKNLHAFFKELKLGESEQKIGEVVLKEIRSRLEYLMKVGLGYLTLHRPMNTLSGGESQRVNLATQLGSSLCGSLYILDEPSIGLHPKDTENLISTLKNLRDLGNTVMVVEHDEQIMLSADWITDLGPGAGIHGGKVLYNGTVSDLPESHPTSETIRYLRRPKENSMTVVAYRNWSSSLKFCPSGKNNLKIKEVEFPLCVLTVICGPSGSGKSTLIMEELVPELEGYFLSGKRSVSEKIINQKHLDLDFMEVVDQKPIGKSSRSNPITYLKVYDDIRMLLSTTEKARRKGISPGYFSFNVEGGRCEKCQGEGVITIEMQFMADVEIPCEACGGKRFKEEALEYDFDGLSVHDILELSIEEAYGFFLSNEKKHKLCRRISEGLRPLLDVGLGYLKMGQSSSTLSGGEAQRIKLAYFLSGKNRKGKGFFIFDEPTTGLHFSDVEKLLHCLNALIAKGHSVLVIEHHPEMIRRADWVIELGPEGGLGGGQIIFQGSPADMKSCKNSVTAPYI
ncbi:MAG: excinuclease ABC subunit UvrA [Bacteroidia bacterium]|nr:excinuclease ABC subunit UvrA [Bacteroidia bacterium]